MRRTVTPLIFGLAATAVLVALGLWQMQRLEWKRAVLDQIDSRIAGAPAALPAAPEPERDRYQPVALTGNLEAEALYVLVSQKRVGAGYRVISAFENETDGTRLLVDRGFVPVDQKDVALATGPAQITGNLHWPDDRNSSTPDNDVAGNIWFARDIPAMAAQLDTRPLLVIARDMTPPDPAVTPLPVDSAGIPNDHLQYAITWFSLAAICLIMTAAIIIRARREKEG